MKKWQQTTIKNDCFIKCYKNVTKLPKKEKNVKKKLRKSIDFYNTIE